MIVFDLHCADGHLFEGWFGSSREFAAQREGGLIACPRCGSQEIDKAPMAPAVPRKGGARAAAEAMSASAVQPAGDTPPSLPPALARALAKVAAAQAEALCRSRWVGAALAETSREMHYGERAAEPIHGRASGEEARSLVEEGIAVVPLLVPIAPPDKVN